MTSNFCKTSWHPYGHTPEECPDCRLCHESKIPKKLEFKPHLTTGVIARDRDMEMLVLWLNELRDYLQVKEEASNYKIVSFDPVGETVPEASKVTIKNNRKIVEVETEPSKLYWSGVEASKGKCNCLCHFNRKPTKEEYAVSSYYGCEHCKSNPPEHEEEFSGSVNVALCDKCGSFYKAVHEKCHPKEYDKEWEKDFDDKFLDWDKREHEHHEDIKSYIRDNFVSKSKIKREIEHLYFSGICFMQTDPSGRKIFSEQVDKSKKSLGLGD